MSDDIKKAAEHIIALCNKHGISESDESRIVARALLSAFEREEKMLATLKSNLGDVMRLNELASALGVMPFSRMEYDIYDAIKAAEEGR